VRPGTSPTTVTATATVWTVNAHAGLLDFEAAMESGPTSYAIDAAVTGAVRAADAFARVDLIWIRQDIPVEDGAAVPAVVPGYTYGTVASTPPATPARCLVIAWINVPASGGGSPSVTWKAPYLSAAGADTRLGSARLATPTVVAGTPSWTTLATLTATTNGGLCVVDVSTILENSNSGANRTGSLSVILDGTALTPAQIDYFLIYLAGGQTPTAAVFNWESTPAAGSHTWVLRANASAASSVTANQAVMTVTEHA